MSWWGGVGGGWHEGAGGSIAGVEGVAGVGTGGSVWWGGRRHEGGCGGGWPGRGGGVVGGGGEVEGGGVRRGERVGGARGASHPLSGVVRGGVLYGCRWSSVIGGRSQALGRPFSRNRHH